MFLPFQTWLFDDFLLFSVRFFFSKIIQKLTKYLENPYDEDPVKPRGKLILRVVELALVRYYAIVLLKSLYAQCDEEEQTLEALGVLEGNQIICDKNGARYAFPLFVSITVCYRINLGWVYLSGLISKVLLSEDTRQKIAATRRGGHGRQI